MGIAQGSRRPADAGRGCRSAAGRRHRLHPDHEAIAARRRVKSAEELAGIRRAQVAADAGMGAAAACSAGRCPMATGSCSATRSSPPGGGAGRAARGMPAPRRAGTAGCHRRLRLAGIRPRGRLGPAPAELPIVIDLGRATRLGLLGGHGPHVRRRRGPRGRCERRRPSCARRSSERGTLCYLGHRPCAHALVCDVFEAAGHRTQRTGPRGRTRTRASSSRSATAWGSRSTRILARPDGP